MDVNIPFQNLFLTYNLKNCTSKAKYGYNRLRFLISAFDIYVRKNGLSAKTHRNIFDESLFEIYWNQKCI